MIGSQGRQSRLDRHGSEHESAPLLALYRIESAILILSRLLVGGIFLLAGLTKVGSPGFFADAVRAYHLMPGFLVLPFAYILPWLELLVAVYLFVGFMARFAATAAIIMLAMFVYALAQSLISGNTHHSCGCFGSSNVNPVLAFLAGGNTVTLWDVIRDIILAVLAALIVLWGAGPWSVDRRLGGRSPE